MERPLHVTAVTLVLASCSPNPSATDATVTDAVTVAADAGDGASATDAPHTDQDAAFTDLPDFTSGARLKARYLATADGMREFQGWYDATRGVNCAFDRMADGSERCLPGAFDGLVQTAYLDAACTHPVALAQTFACESPRGSYLVETAEGACGRQVRAIGDAITPVPAQLFRSFAGACRAMPLDASQTVASVGDVIAPSMFVARTVRHGTASTRLVGTWKVADDGSSERTGWYDTMLATECTRGETTAGPRCIPDTDYFHYQGAWYADSTCTARAAVGFTSVACPAPTPTYLRSTSSDGCDTTGVFRVGAEVAPADVYRPGTGTTPCESAAAVFMHSGMSVARLYRLGDEITSDRLAPLETTHANGPARLRPIVESSTVGGPPRAGTASTGNFGREAWYDATLDTLCALVDTGDHATFACRPAGPSNVYYTDDACGHPILGGYTVAACPVPDPRYSVLGVSDGTACGNTVHVRRLGARLTPPMLFTIAAGTSGSAGTCTTVGTSDNTFWTEGDEVPTTMLATATLAHD